MTMGFPTIVPSVEKYWKEKIFPALYKLYACDYLYLELLHVTTPPLLSPIFLNITQCFEILI